MAKEKDPLGLGQHAPGAKLDDGKLKAALVLDDFARALERVCLVGTVGAVKYTEGGWLRVPNGIKRYKDAERRHSLKGAYERFDPELSERAGQPVEHRAAKIWNDLAVLELELRGIDEEQRKNAALSGAGDGGRTSRRVRRRSRAKKRTKKRAPFRVFTG